MAERPLYTLYKNLKAQNYDVPDDYNKFESALTRDGKGGADNRHAIYENLKAQNFDVPNTYERFYSALFEPRSKTSSRAKGGSVPMSAADRARFSAGAAAISASAQHTMNNAGRYNRLKQRKQKQQKDFGRVNLGTHQTPYGGDANNVVKDDFAYNPETGKAGAYVSSDNENVYSQPEAEQKQDVLDQQNNAYQEAVDTGEIPSVFDVRDKNGNYDLQENINKNGTYLTEEGARNQFDKKLADAYARKKEIEALIAEDHRQHGNPLLSYGASIGASNGRTAEQSDYSNKLATSLAMVKQQIGALEAVKQYPTSSWSEDALKALDNTAFTAKTWDFGLTDFATMGQMERIKTKMDNNLPLSGSDKMLLKSKLGADAAAALEDEKMGNIYRWTKIAGQSLPFMADFFLTGGYGGITKAISRGALKFAAKRGMGKVSAAILKNTGIVAGDVIGSYAMAGSEQAMKTGADIMQRHLGSLYQDEKGDYKFGTFDENGNLLHEGGESMGTALYKGLTSAMVENYTEKLFGHSYGIKKGAINFMEKHGMNASAEFFKNIGKSGWYTNSKKWMEKFGINGFGEEVMEEEIGIPLHALLDGDNKFSDLLDTKQQLDIIGGMALSVGSMYAMGAGSRPVKGVYNRAQYYRFRNKVNVADSDAQNLMGDKWADIKDKIDNTTNEQMGGVLADILRQRDTMSKEQINAAINYGINLMKMRGYNVAKTAEMNAREITNEPTTPEEQHQADIDNAYSEGHDADDADKHDIQLEHEDQMKTLAGLLNISEQQLSAMNDDELQSLTGQNDKLDQAIYDYQLSSARYQGVTDDAQDKIDMAANQAAQRVDMYTDKSRGSVRNATVKASGGAEDYGVYIISGNIATNEDGSINVADSDDMILFYDPMTNSVEHADALRFAELGDEVPADDVKTQAVADAKEKAIKEVAGIVDGTIDVGSQFKVTGADGLEHTYEILADYGDGTAAISIDGNVVENPYSLEDLQQLKDLEDQKRLEAAKAQREQMEKERAEQTQETELPEETQPSFDFNQILNDNGNVVLADVLGKDGNTKYPNSQLFLIRDSGAKAKVMELKSDGTLVPHAVNKKDVRTATTMTLNEYKQAFADSSMIEENSGAIEGDRGGIEVNDELPPVPDNVTINGDGTYSVDGAVQGGENATAPAEQTEQTPAMTLEDGTIVPMLEDGNPDFSKLTADQTAELYDSQFGEDADSVISGWVSDAKKALDKASNMTVKGKNFVEQKAAKEAKEKAIADAQAAYDSAVAIRDAYNERQLAKVEDTADGRKNLIEKARRKFSRLKSAVKDDAEAVSQLYKDVVGSLLHRLYDGTGIDVTDTIPLTAEEYVASNLGAHSLNYEGTETSKGVKQETGLSREDFAKTQLLAADGKGTTIDDLVHSLWENRPSNLDSLDTQDIRNALIGVLTSGFKASEAINYIENLRIAQAENILEEQKKAADNAAFAEEQKAKQEEEQGETEQENTDEEKSEENEQINENINAPELSHEQQKAMEEGEKLGFPAFDKEGEPINEYVVELAKWAKKQGLEIDPTSKLNSYADLFLMCKDGFGVITLVPDEGENINQVVYFPDNVKDFDQLWKLQEEFNAGRDLKHSSNIDSELTEGAIFYDGDTAREFKEFVDKKVEKQNKVFGEQRPEEDLPFSAKENGKQQTTAERAAGVEKNKVDDMKVVDNIVGEKTRKAFERLAKMMGAKIQWQYSDKLGNGWIQETKDADGNIHRTIFITLDSSITEGAQFIFGHEMTHQIKSLNPAAYNELTQLVLDTYGSDAFGKAIDETMKRYSDAGFSGRARDYYAEEVVADAVGEMIRDLNLAHTLAMKMSHPLLAAIHEILQKIKLAFFGTEYSDVTKNIIRSIEQAYVKTAKGEVTNSETGEDVSFSLRQKPEPKKKGIGYKVFVLKDGKLYPPMVANPNGAATPVGVWLDADAAPIAGESKTGRPQVKQGGKGTQGGSGKLAYRPGWHLGVVPYAIQFNRKDAEGNKTLFPKNFVFAEVEYAADVDYQEEARQEGINPSGKYQHSLAGLKHLPTDGYYMYRTNPNPETDPWVITGAMKVNRILTRAEQAELVKNAGREPQQIQEGDIVTDDVVNSINQEIADAPKFSLKVYHGSGADFTEFDFDHMGEGAGSQAFGWGGYVTSSEEIGKSYVELTRKKPTYFYNGKELSEDYLRSILLNKVGRDNANILDDFLYNLEKYGVSEAKSILRKGDYAYFKDLLKGTRGSIRSGYQNKVDAAELLLAPRNIRVKKYKGNLYEVDIPDDNGSNYLDWDAPLTDKQKNTIIKELRRLKIDFADFKKRGFSFDGSFSGNAYDFLMYALRKTKKWKDVNASRAVSKFLSSIGYTGIKYPAGTIMGGVEGYETNYVIFKPEDMKITEHTKFSLRLKSAIEETETNPSDAQKESGNYKKGHIKFGGYDYTIENPKGSTRSGKDADGKEWKVTMHDTYGYIRGKFGKDGDHLDMFINDKADLDNWNGDVFVVDQVNPDGSFDEHKVMYGYDSMDDAEKAYLANYSKGWKGLGNITGVSKDEFDKWLDTSNRKLKPFADYAKVKFSLKDEKIKSIAEKFGVNEDDVAMYANAVERGSTAEAARARANIKRYLLQANEDKISSFKDIIKYTKPINEALKENFGDLDAMIEERRKQVEAQRNAMEAARKRAQEEEEKRQKHLDELSLIPTDELDKRYMDAIANNDESTAREMLDESARRNGYGDVGSDYQGQGAWAAPSNPQYESDEARRADIENSPDVNLEDIALGYNLQPDDYFDNPRAYMNNTAYGLESAHVIKNALDAIKNGEKDVKVKVYRAVPTSVKEGKLRNGDWVTPSKKYAEMHGDNRLDGKYRIIEDEVPANQLWWDGNDVNEFGFDDGKEYRYKNAKNNRKLNDLITYDNKGNVIPPSNRFNSRKSDIRFSLRDMADGKESGAADMAEDLKSLNTPDEVDDAIKTAIDDMPIGWQMANKKMIHIAQALGENRKAEIAGEEPKFSLKDGTLIKAGTYFSGGGLVEEGLKGIIDPVVAVEYDEKISGVYRNNFGQHIVTADVRDVDPRELVKQIDGEVEYFHASPVCKNYSQAKSNHAEVELDKETAASTADFINAVKPKVVTIENVKGYKDSDAMKTITDALDANGYTWDADVYNAADYGGYTNRERLIVRAVRDGKLPDKPKKMAHKSGWYEAVADIIPTLTEKKNGVAPWMDVRLKADGIDWRNIDKPLYVMGSAYADGKVPHAFADELLPTLRTKSGDVIVMPDGKLYRAMGRVLARVSGVSDDYKMPFSENLSHTIIGNGIPTQLTEHVIAPLLTGSDPKFSIRTYHGTGAKFDKFDLSHALEGEGSETFGHGVYVTNSKEIGTDYAQRAKDKKAIFGFEFVNPQSMSKEAQDMLRHYMYKHQDVAKGLENARKDLKDVIEKFPDTDYLQELNEILAKDDDSIAIPSNRAYRYDVDIPDDNGSNYLGWNESQNFPLEKWYRLWEITHEGFNENEYFKDGGARYDIDRIERITQMKLESPENGMQKLPTLKGEELYHALEDFFNRERPSYGAELASRALSEIGFVGIKYPAGMIHGGAKEGDYNYVIFDENNANIVGNTRFSLRYDQFEHDLNQWKKDNNLPKDAQRPTIPQRNAGESAVDFLRRVDEYRKQMALWKTAPTYEQHLLSDDTALGEFNRELQRGSVLKRIAFQDSMLAIRKAQEAIMKEVGVDRLNMAEDAYTAENRSHGKGKNEFEEYNNEFLQPLRKAYHQMKKVLGNSYDNVRVYMMAKHGLERDAQMAFKKSLEADYEDVNQRSAAYKAYKNDLDRVSNDADFDFGRVDFTTWRQKDNALRGKYSPSYMDYRYDENGVVNDYSGLSQLFGGSDFEEAAHKLVRDIESKHVAEVQDLWNATNAATKKILRDGFKAGMMSKDTYEYVKGMYSHYIPLRGWDGTTADQVWDYIGGGKGAFNQTLKTAHGRTSIADDPIAYIENMAESGILLNNKNWVKQHLMLLAQNHPTSLLTLSKAWYVKSTDANGNEEWIPATPQITSQMNSNQVKAAIDAFEQKMEQLAQTGDATQQRDGLNIAYPQTHSEEREHEVRVMKDGEEYVIYVNGDPQLAQAMNNTRAHRVREIQSGKLDRAAAWLGRKMAAAYTSLSPLFIPSNYFRDLTMTLASTAIREDGRYNYLLRKNLATSWNLGFMLRDYQNGKLREKVSNGNATPKEQMFYDFMMNGGETGFVSSLDVEDLKKKFKNDLKDLDRWKANPVKVGHTIMDGIEFLNRAIEDSNRFAVYMTSIQYGRSIDEAVNDAKDVTLNFNRKGTGEYGWQMIRNLYLFINPAVQSLQTLGALAKHHPFKFTAVTAAWLASGVLVPIVNAALMSLLGGDDDKDKYWQFSKWDRRNNAIMWIPFTNEYVKIPLAQEFRAFYGIGDMIASKMMGGELAEETWSQYAEDLLGQVVDMLPLDPTGYDGNIAVSLMPNPIRPVFELAFNVDFTGKPLFKDTEYNKYDPNFTKAYVGTPDWLVRVSKMVNSIGNDYPDVQQNAIDAFGDPRYNLNNPAVVDHVLSSYLGGAYTMGSQVLGLLTKSLNDPKEIKMADIPLVSKFVSNPDDRPVTKKQGDEFWNMKENHDRAANTLSKLKKQAKVDGDYSMLERFYGSEEYKQYKQEDVKVKKYEEDKKKERAEESGEEYRPHKLNAEDIYKAHATPKDDFEDLKLKQLYTKLNGFKTSYDLLVDTAPGQSDGYYNTNKAAIDAIDEISIDKQEISELKKGFLEDGKDAYNAEDMKRIRELRKRILSVLEPANKVVVANQKAKAEKK